jgi:hypothetical protein
LDTDGDWPAAAGAGPGAEDCHGMKSGYGEMPYLWKAACSTCSTIRGLFQEEAHVL